MSGVIELSGGLVIKRLIDYDYSDECYYVLFEIGKIHKPILLLDQDDIAAIARFNELEEP